MPSYKLPRNYYRTLWAQIDTHENYLRQLQRDLQRGIQPIFAVDNSELHEYLRPFSSERSAANEFIFTNTKEGFSILPGSLGELFQDLNNIASTRMQRDVVRSLHSDPAVKRFVQQFPNLVADNQELIRAYAEAESVLRSKLGGVFDILIQDGRYSSIRRLQELINRGKLVPIEGIRNIDSIPSDIKQLAGLVMDNLSDSRPDKEQNNLVDTADYAIAMTLNHRDYDTRKKYTTIYSQSTSVLRAMRSNESLLWREDYIVRDVKYLICRTKIHAITADPVYQLKRIRKCLEMASRAKQSIGRISELDDPSKKTFPPSIDTIHDCLAFYNECMLPLQLFESDTQLPSRRSQAEQLYESIKDKKRFEVSVDQAYDFLQIHLRRTMGQLDQFKPNSIDNTTVKRYKRDLARWLK